jgi:hypothetical protein
VFSSPVGPGNDCGGVVAQKVHSLAQFRNRIGQGLAGFGNTQREQLGGVRFEEVGRAGQDAGAFARRHAVPGTLTGHGQVEGSVDVRGCGEPADANDLVRSGRID